MLRKIPPTYISYIYLNRKKIKGDVNKYYKGMEWVIGTVEEGGEEG